MEVVYPRVPKTDIPEVFVRRVRAGPRGLLPVGHRPHVLGGARRRITASCCGTPSTWATNEPRPVEVDGPGLLDVTVWRQKSSMTVHLVNLTNPMMMKGPVREFFPVGPLKFRCACPRCRTPGRRSYSRRAGRSTAVRSGGELRLSVPRVELHEVVAFDL